MTLHKTATCCLVSLCSLLHAQMARADLACKPTALFEPESLATVADLRNDGRILAMARDEQGWGTFVWTDDSTTRLIELGASELGLPVAFNEQGEAVALVVVDGTWIPTLWKDGVSTSLSLDVVDRSVVLERVFVRDINAHGQIIADDHTKGICLLWHDAHARPISIAPDDTTHCRALGINDRGDVLFVVPSAYLVRHADGTLTRIADVPVPPPFEQFGIINNAGTVVGTYGAADRSFVFRAQAGNDRLTIHDGMPLALNDEDDFALVPVRAPVPVILGSEHPIDLIDRHGNRRQLGALPKLPLFRWERAGLEIYELDPRVYLNAGRQLAWTTQEVVTSEPVPPKLFPVQTLQLTAFTCQLP